MKAFFFTSVLAALALTSCSSVTVNTDRDASADFSKYRSYSLAPTKPGRSLSPTSENALLSSLRTGLAARGLREDSPGKADLSVVRHAFSQEKISVEQYTDWGYGYGPGAGWPYHGGRYGMWAGAPSVYTDVRQYTEGTLVLDFVDRRTKKLVFRGIGRGTIGSTESNAAKIQSAVTQITARFPAPTVAP